ncbi:unnamed protein product [Sympodiomycopsis kandeliae]
MGSVEECSSQSAFDAALQKAGSSQLVVVDFTASWCGPCKMIKPHFEALAKQHTNVKFLKVDVDANPATSRAYGVSAMPTFLFIKNKSVLETIRGADRNKLTATVEKHASGSSGSSSAFSGAGNTLSGSSRTQALPLKRHNPLGDDHSDDEAGGQDDREEGEAREGDLDPELQAFLDSRKASEQSDVETLRMREERIKAGGMRNVKSKYQRDKEEAQRKKEQGEKDAAQAYDEFVKAMDGGSSSNGQASRSKPMGFVAAGGSSYNPSRQPPPSSAFQDASSPPEPKRTPASSTKNNAGRSSGGPLGGMFDDNEEEEAEIQQPQSRREPPGKRKRAMDDFLGELQKEQAEREERYKDRIPEGKSVSAILALESQPTGTRDFGDPLTTNVCALNLPANISEKALGDFFCQWGDIGTVKIMWPRGEESTGGAGGGITAYRNTKSSGLIGFVCYMKREDAEYAMKEADGISWGGCTLATSWGKAMPRPARAFYVMPLSSKQARQDRERASAGRRSTSPSGKRRSSSGSPTSRERPSRSVNAHRHVGMDFPRTELYKDIQSESSEEQAKLIQAVVERIEEYGPSFEDMIREKEKDNPKFDFLRDGDRDEVSVQAEYFKTLLDGRYVPRLKEVAFSDEGYRSLYESDSGEDSETERLKKLRKTDTLGRFSRKRFESMLRSLTLRRERIARCTAFAIEHANASETIAHILTCALLIPSTPIPRKLSRLYVLSDILHNSSVPLPNAWKYRSSFESHSRLEVVFQHWGQVAKSYPGIMKQESVKSQLRNLLDVWDDWMVLSPGLVEKLRGCIENPPATNVTMKVQDQVAIQGEDIDGEDIDGEDIDGEEMV